jgi:hypothetical protein
MSKYKSPLNKLRDELKEYLALVEKGGTQKVIDSAYEITFKKEILNLLECNEGTIEIPYVVSLDYLYNSWCDWAGESLEDCTKAALQTIREGFVEIATNFGVIYIEPYDFDERDEEDKIKFFDSELRPLGVVSVATHIAPACSYSYEKEYEEFCDEVSGIESINALLEFLGREWSVMSKDPNKLPLTETEAEINKIGDIYFF